jgi:hypothetical protein
MSFQDQYSKENMLSECDRFSSNLGVLVDDICEILGELYEEYPTLQAKSIFPSLSIMKIARDLTLTFDKTTIIESFIKNSRPHWDEIYKKDTNFFISHAGTLFSIIPVNIVEQFGNMFKKKVNDREVMTEEDMDRMWQGLHSLVVIAIKYIAKNRSKEQVQSELKMWNVTL